MADRAKELNNFKCVIRALLVVNNGPVEYSTLMKEYRIQEGRTVPYAKFGYPDCLSFLESLPDTVLIERTADNVLISAQVDESLHYIQTLVQAQKPREPAPRPVSRRARERASSPQLPELVLENILNLMGENGVQARVLRDAYYQHYGMSLDVEQYGFASLEDCLASVRLTAENEKGLLEAIVAVLAQYPEGVYMSHFAEAYARERGRQLTLGTMHLVRRWPQLFNLQKPDSSGDFILLPASCPSAVLLPPKPLPVRSSVRVTDVRGGPAVLTVTLQAPNSDSSLALLEAAMNHFYGPSAFGPPFDAQPSRACAAFCGETWRRGRVVSVSGDLVQVQLVDVGGCRLLAPHQLRPLAPRFTELPEMCTVATLNLPPRARAWCATADQRLRKLTLGRQMMCLFDGASVELQDDKGQLLTRQLATEGLCKPAWQLVTLSNQLTFTVVWLEQKQYIFSEDLSKLVGWKGDSALEEFQRRGICFRCINLCRESPYWCTVEPLLASGTTAVSLFPANNILDAVNVLCYPYNQVGIEARDKLAKLDDI